MRGRRAPVLISGLLISPRAFGEFGMATISRISTLEQLQSVFPGVILIDSRSAARALGIATKTIHNAGEDFPIRSVRFGRKKFFRILDVASYLDQQLGIVAVPAQPCETLPAHIGNESAPALKRGRGRPRKDCALRAAGGVSS